MKVSEKNTDKLMRIAQVLRVTGEVSESDVNLIVPIAEVAKWMSELILDIIEESEDEELRNKQLGQTTVG